MIKDILGDLLVFLIKAIAGIFFIIAGAFILQWFNDIGIDKINNIVDYTFPKKYHRIVIWMPIWLLFCVFMIPTTCHGEPFLSSLLFVLGTYVVFFLTFWNKNRDIGKFYKYNDRWYVVIEHDLYHYKFQLINDSYIMEENLFGQNDSAISSLRMNLVKSIHAKPISKRMYFSIMILKIVFMFIIVISLSSLIGKVTHYQRPDNEDEDVEDILAPRYHSNE